ncbi:DUF2460 domain-containing protein [Brevundimonas sp. BAL3]|uniref:DUF2460 domain-containing protein n=1 Tax=Brevundimonas sp. BAL3 TaxID=391600 RepID=UPI00017EB721|nr:DUF2460 domain-containing protein [Brevundimonas sp. BAL3]EDX81070.1 conserved hypothetical protein TIGR02217 [Brevundimonas sp. BAL3]
MPSPFLNISFPPAVARGATGGPGFSTQVVTLASGAENRNSNWAKARGSWDISTGIRTRAQMADVVSHFYVVGGKAQSFRFKDWADFDATDVVMVPVTTTVFQMVKRYVRGGSEYVRTITKPVTGTVTIKVSGSPVTPSSIDYLTGRVTFASPPAATPTATFQFDVPCRFDTDRLPVQTNAYDQMVVPQIDLIEVRE